MLNNIINNIAVLLRPSIWIRSGPVSYEWDRKLNALMDEHDFAFDPSRSYYAKLGDRSIWIANHPYGSFSPEGHTYIPTRKTALRAIKKLDEDCPVIITRKTTANKYEGNTNKVVTDFQYLPKDRAHGDPIAELLTKDGFKIAPQRMSNKNQILDGYELKSHIYTGTYDEIKSMLMPDKDKILYLWDNGFYPWYNLEYSYKIDRYDRYAWIAVATR